MLNPCPEGPPPKVQATLVETTPGLPINSLKAVTRRSPGDLVALAQELQKADDFVRATTSSKLQVIVEQVRHLQEMAHRILLEARESSQLHHAACNFKKVPGHTYFLYQRPSGQVYFSMLSPQDWGPSCPHEYQGSYRLEFDQSWTPVEKIEDRDAEMKVVDRILDASSLQHLLGKPEHVIMGGALAIDKVSES